MAFELDPRLAGSSIELGRLGRSRVLLKNNAHFIWLLLVPETAVTEFHELPAEQFEEVCGHTRQLSTWVKEAFHVDKINVAAIGNIVNQLHIHIVGRNRGDVAWPGTVWACDEKRPFSDGELLDFQTRFTLAFTSTKSS
jgi:diadenosine tetraphosphate (Ap4A) HIT family hydrolase